MGKNKNREKKDGAAPGSPLAGQAHLIDLIQRGDFRAARAEAKKTLSDPAVSEADKAAARDVVGRLAVDRTTLAVGLLGALVLAVIAVLVLR